jgi:hypothetical protein
MVLDRAQGLIRELSPLAAGTIELLGERGGGQRKAAAR